MIHWYLIGLVGMVTIAGITATQATLVSQVAREGLIAPNVKRANDAIAWLTEPNGSELINFPGALPVPEGTGIINSNLPLSYPGSRTSTNGQLITYCPFGLVNTSGFGAPMTITMPNNESYTVSRNLDRVTVGRPPFDGLDARPEVIGFVIVPTTSNRQIGCNEIVHNPSTRSWRVPGGIVRPIRYDRIRSRLFDDSQAAQNIYVSPTGTNTGFGETPTSPVSLHRAFSILQERQRAYNIIWLQPGSYTMSGDVTIAPTQLGRVDGTRLLILGIGSPATGHSTIINSPSPFRLTYHGTLIMSGVSYSGMVVIPSGQKAHILSSTIGAIDVDSADVIIDGSTILGRMDLPYAIRAISSEITIGRPIGATLTTVAVPGGQNGLFLDMTNVKVQGALRFADSDVANGINPFIYALVRNGSTLVLDESTVTISNPTQSASPTATPAFQVVNSFVSVNGTTINFHPDQAVGFTINTNSTLEIQNSVIGTPGQAPQLTIADVAGSQLSGSSSIVRGAACWTGPLFSYSTPANSAPVMPAPLPIAGFVGNPPAATMDSMLTNLTSRTRGEVIRTVNRSSWACNP